MTHAPKSHQLPATNYQLTLIIPAYNEEQRLRPFLESIVEFNQTNQLISEIIIVDDGSSDQTAAIAQAFRSRLPLRVLRHHHNRGKGAAVRTGIKAARGNLVVFIDADGATPITELPKMYTALQRSDIAIGNRWIKGAVTERHSALRKLSGYIYRSYMKLFGLGAIDTMCGFKGYKKHVARALFADLIEDRWLFDTEIAYKAIRRGYKIINFPIHWESKDGSKLDTKTLIISALQIWPLIRKINKK